MERSSTAVGSSGISTFAVAVSVAEEEGLPTKPAASWLETIKKIVITRSKQIRIRNLNRLLFIIFSPSSKIIRKPRKRAVLNIK